MDIASGAVNIDDVERIIGSTAVQTDEELNFLIHEYRQTYWENFPDEAERIFRQLMAEKKIEQPRLSDRRHMPLLHNQRRWVNARSEIIWYDQMRNRVE